MDNMVKRDWRGMVQFADDIKQYCDNMKKVCEGLKSDMDSARPTMRDEISQRAFTKIEAFVNNLIESLPVAEDVETRLRKSAGFLKAAEVLKDQM